MTRRTASALACLAASAATGCGGETTTAAEHPQARRGGHGNNDPTFHYPLRSKVTIRDDGFHPKRISVRTNTKVTWVNRGDRAHTVRWVRGSSGHFRSRRIAPGGTFKHRFANVGRVVYRSTAPGDRGFRGVVEVG